MSEQANDKLLLHGESTDSAVTDLAASSQTAEATSMVQSAAVMAKRFPRNEEAFFQAITRSCQRSRFAEGASYAFKRGKTKNPVTGRWEDNVITGPSIKLAREAKRLWGNIRTGLEILVDEAGDGTSRNPGLRRIRGWAWDLQTNTFESFEDSFQKLIQRKVGKWPNQKTEWVIPDERDLRELTFRKGAICQRNAILAVLPPDMIDDAREVAYGTLKSEVEKDPDSAKKKVLIGFNVLNISSEMLEEYLGHPLRQISPAEIIQLREIYASIRDGNSSWAEYTGEADEAQKPKDIVGKADIPKAKAKPKAAGPPWKTIAKKDLASIVKRLKALGVDERDLLATAQVDEEVSKLADLPLDELDKIHDILDAQEERSGKQLD